MGILETYLRENFSAKDPGKKGNGIATADAMIGQFRGTGRLAENFDLAISLSEESLIEISKEVYLKLGYEVISKSYAQPLQLKKENVFLGITITQFGERARVSVVGVGD